MATKLKETPVEEPAIDAQADDIQAPARRSLITFAGLVRGVDVELRNGAAGIIVAADDVHVDRGGARSIVAGGGLQLQRGGAGLIVAGGDAHVAQGGAQAIISAGSISMESAGSGFAIGRRIRIGPRGLAVFAIAPRLDVHEGGRVIFGRLASFALLGGIAGAIGLVVLQLRRRGG
jgi:hypothetical protein